MRAHHPGSPFAAHSWLFLPGLLTVTLILVSCHDTASMNRCLGVTCSGRGECVLEGGTEAVCDCEEGFRDVNIECVPDVDEGWVFIEDGDIMTTFNIGSPENEHGRADDENLHLVTLTTGLVVQATEVTQVEFQTSIGYNPSHFGRCGEDCPVEQVTWHEAAAFCNARSDAQGMARCYECSGTPPNVECDLNPIFDSIYACPAFRLPTEAEWEYMARAGTTTATYNGDLDEGSLGCEHPNDSLDPIAAFCGTSPYSPERVGEREPNPWGLFDILGNVREWCHDWYGEYPDTLETTPTGPSSGTERVHRGGSFVDNAADTRAAHRGQNAPEEATDSIGFRMVRNWYR